MEQVILWIAIGAVALAVAWAAFSYRYFYKHQHFVCPKSGHSFKPPVKQMVFSVNAVSGKIIRCPSCGEKEYMEPVRDE